MSNYDDLMEALIEADPFLGRQAVAALAAEQKRVIELEAIIDRVRNEAQQWEKSPGGEAAPTRIVGSHFLALLSTDPKKEP